MKSLKNSIFLTVLVALTAVVKASAGDGTTTAMGILNSTTSAELPAKAAELVAHADAKNLKQTTIDVVKAAVGLNPAAAPAIVGSIAQASPDMAAIAASVAAALVPNQATAIARAAAAAAPAKAGAIVEAICKVLPSYFQAVATAVAEVVPGSGKEILTAIATSIPDLKNSINQTLASYNGSIPSVSAVLAQVVQNQNAVFTVPTLAASSGIGSSAGASPAAPILLPQGPSSVPPQVPIVTGPILNPGNSTPAPGGGHNYSAP